MLIGVVSGTAAAQQPGSIQLSSNSQIVAGTPGRIAGEHPFEPDVAVLWTQPGTSFGQFQFESHGTRRGNDAHLGRTWLALRDARRAGLTWSFEAGDLYGGTDPGDYQFSNLSTPALSFTGGFVTVKSARTTVQVGGGRTNALRNIFGTDPEMLGQSLAIVRATVKPDPRWVFNARAARTRTSNLREFARTVDASEQAGGGARFIAAPWLQFVADTSYVQYRATGSTRETRDYSYIAGSHLLLSRGSVELDATRFSPGDLPLVNAALQDRSGVFASADYDIFKRARVFGGWESVAININPAGEALLRPEATSNRGFAGTRVRVFGRSTISFRVEDGGRVAKPIPGYPVVNGVALTESDTGSYSAEWQTSLRKLTAFARYTTRDNIDVTNGTGTFSQRDATGQVFLNLSRRTQLFGGATLTRQNAQNGATTYLEVSGGTQQQLFNPGLWLRVEGTATRNRDLASGLLSPRDSAGIGLNGQLTRYTTIGFNVYVDRAPIGLVGGDDGWLTRSTLRIVRTIPTGATRLANSGVASDVVRAARGSGSIVGSVFADWNGNGVPDAGEEVLAGIPVRLGSSSNVTTARDGQFSFLNVPAGTEQVGLDLNALPVDFDAPAPADITVELSRGDTRRVSFGLIPLGSIHGRVVEDANRNGRVDPGEPGVEGAVTTMDGGARSELARKGAFRFDAVRAGDHRIELLKESLPDGSVIVGDAERRASITRGGPDTEIVFLVRIDKRPELRKVFPPKIGMNAKRAPERIVAKGAPEAARPSDAAGPPVSAAPPDGSAGTFTIQIAALNDPISAKAMVAQLRAAGFGAYLLEPGAGAPGPYRVRVGRFRTRDIAQRAAGTLEARLNEKLWVTRAR